MSNKILKGIHSGRSRPIRHSIGRRVSFASAAIIATVLAACETATESPETKPAITIEFSSNGPEVGDSVTVKAILRHATGVFTESTDVIWSSSAPEVAEVVGAFIHARSPGTVRITAISPKYGSGSANFTVLVPVAAIEVEPAVLSLLEGRSARLFVTLRDSAGSEIRRPVQYSADDVRTASIDDAGIVKAASLGSTFLTLRVGPRTARLPVKVVTGNGFTLADLGIPEGSQINDLNNRGWIVGYSVMNNQGRATLWRSGRVVDLHPFGLVSSGAYVVNDGGLIVGAGSSGSGAPALWRWQDGITQSVPLPPPPGGELIWIQPNGINSSGIVVGTAASTTGNYAFRLEGLAVSWLGPERYQNATDINDAGDIAVDGSILRGGTSRFDIPNSPTVFGPVTTRVLALNNRQDAAGVQGSSLSGTVGFVRSQAYGSQVPFSTYILSDLNEYGEALGNYQCPAGCSFIAHGIFIRDGEATRLGHQAVTGWYVRFAWEINDLGQIVGMACREATNFSGACSEPLRNVLLTPN